MSTVEFRTPEQEVEKLLEECQMLRGTLKEISARLSRMENRVRRAFPTSAVKVAARQRIRSDRPSDGIASLLTSEQALAEFERAVQLARNDPISAENYLHNKSSADLATIAREVGVSFRKGRPSRKAVKDALYGKIRESLLLSKHHTPRSPAA